jgi:hypothetical protein
VSAQAQTKGGLDVSNGISDACLVSTYEEIDELRAALATERAAREKAEAANVTFRAALEDVASSGCEDCRRGTCPPCVARAALDSVR